MEWWNNFVNKVVTFFNDNVWNIVAFFATLIIGIILIKVIMMVVKRIFRRRGIDEMAIKFVMAILRFALWLVLILILLSELGIPVSGLTTSLSAAVLAVGMALKDFLANLASGIILVGSRKYKTGDYLKVGGVDGCIVDINFLFTTLKTFDSTQVTMPNSTMVNSAVTNFGAYPTRRVTFLFSVAYESDVKLVVKTVVDVMKSCGKVLLDPEPCCRLKNYNASSIDFWCACYCDNSDYWDVYYYVMEHVFDEFKRNKISIPYQQIEVRERKDEVVLQPAYDELPRRVEKVRVATKKKMTVEDWEDMGIKQFVGLEKQTAEDAKRKIKEEKAKKKAESKKKAKSKSETK